MAARAFTLKMTGNHTLTCLVNSHAHCQLLHAAANSPGSDNGTEPTPAVEPVEIEFQTFSWKSSSLIASAFLGRRVGCWGRKTGYTGQLPQPAHKARQLDSNCCAVWMHVDVRDSTSTCRRLL